MAAIGLQFDKVQFERKNPLSGNVKVNNNVRIKEVSKTEVGKRDAMRFGFEFTIQYEPGIASLTLDGFVNVLAKPEIIKEELDKWKKDKKVSNELMTEVINNVLAKGNVTALILTREVNLPPPIDLPKVRVK